MGKKMELQIVLDPSGLKCVRVAGPPEEHKEGHDLYFKILDLVDEFDKAIQERLKEEPVESQEVSEGKSKH